MGTALQISLRNPASTAAGENVLFDSTDYLSGGVSYNAATGEITFSEEGRFVVNWWLATQSAPLSSGIVFTLCSSGGDDMPGSSPVKTGEVYGVGIIDVDEVPMTLSLVNAGASAVYFSSMVPIKGTLAVAQDSSGGPTGPEGPTGPTGPIGPGGPEGPTGPGITVYGYAYSPLDEAYAVMLPGNVIFNCNGPLTGITHTVETAQMTVPATGDYLIEYTVVVANNIDAVISIAVNGITEVSTSVPTQTEIGEFSDSSILSLEAGDIVTLRIE